MIVSYFGGWDTSNVADFHGFCQSSIKVATWVIIIFYKPDIVHHRCFFNYFLVVDDRAG